MPDTSDTIRIEDLEFSYQRGAPIIAVADLRVAAGTVLSILGPSGIGKTTLLLLVAGLLEPDRGTITVGGRSPRSVRADGTMGFVFQSPTLVPWRTVAGNLALPFELQGKNSSPHDIQQCLDLVGLAAARGAFPDELSGGMRSRVALARALVTNPGILLLDEPFADLDEFNRLRLNLALAEIHQRLQMTVLVVTHNIQDALFLSDRIILIERVGSPSGPASVKEDIDIGFENRTVDSIRSRDFQSMYQRLVSAFRNEASR